MAEHRDAGPAVPGTAPYRFGVAGELDRDGIVARRTRSSTRTRPGRARPDRFHGGRWDHLLSWWASRDRHPGGLWRRLRCRSGRHDVRGGQQVQLGSRFVNVPRCCVWCGAVPPPLGPQSTTASGPVRPGMIR
ncbi:MAG: hypothetical protein M3O23_05570 [Actinomycetota bacterium]|nr:hypothetical protein [Actinomycetota bacterium]